MPGGDVGRVRDSGIEVALLGPVELCVGGAKVPVTAKQAAVLAMLALEAGRVLSVDRLIDGVWGDDAPRTVRASLQVQVSQLRQTIADRVPDPVIVTRAPGYLLDIEADAVDALRFGHLVAQSRRCLSDGDVAGAARTADKGLQLWRGDALSGLGEVPFAGPVATRLADQRLDLVEMWADAEIACGRAEMMIAPLESWVVVSPYRETLWQRLILALYRCGRQVDALARLADLRRVLRDEVGVRPCSAIVELETAILDHDGALDAALPTPLPERLSGPGRRLPATRDLVGRDGLIADVTELCRAAPLVTLVGPGGVGKTSLAANVAAEFVNVHADGVWFVDLSRVVDATLVATAIGAAVGLRSGEGGLLIDAVVELLLDTSLLLVVDNCEHVVAHAAAAIEEILARCRGVRILATSRERLAVPEESAVVVPALEPADAATLLDQRARRAGATTAGDEASDIASLCDAVDRLPLGIELVAARLQSMSVADIVSQLGSGQLLQLGRRTVNDRQRSLHSTIQWSYDLLSGSSQTLVRRLAVFEGGATLDAIQAICADPNATIDGELIADVLDTAVASSLINIDRTERQPRYRLLETVKTFAARCLSEPERSETRRRHAEEMIAWGRRMRLVSEGPDPAPAFSAIVAEAANLRAAFDFYASSQDHAGLARLVGAPGPLLWRESGAIHELDSWVDVALYGGGVAPVDRLGVLLVAAFRSGRPISAERQWADEALELATRLGDQPSAAFAEFLVGDVALDEAGPHAEARLLSAIGRWEAAGQWRNAGHAVSTYANLLLREWRIDEAVALLGPRLRSHDSYGASEAYLHYQHARLLLMTGDVDGASAGFDAALRDGVRCGVPLSIGFAWYGKALVAEAQHDPVTAREYLERSLVIDMQAGDRRDHLSDRISLVRVTATLGDLSAAREHAAIIAELARNNPEPREIGYQAHAHGIIALAEGDAVMAKIFLLQALDAFAPTHLTECVAEILDAFLCTLPEPRTETLCTLPADVRERRVSAPEALAILRNNS